MTPQPQPEVNPVGRPKNTHRRAVLAAQKTLNRARRTAEASGYTLAALLERAGISPRTWETWARGRAVPRAASIDAVVYAAASLECQALEQPAERA